jgi:hypothetical protein
MVVRSFFLVLVLSAVNAATKVCKHGSPDCAPLTRAEYGSAVSLWIVLPYTAAVAYGVWGCLQARD